MIVLDNNTNGNSDNTLFVDQVQFVTYSMN